MNVIDPIKKPSKEEQRIARVSHDILLNSLKGVHSDLVELEVEETQDRIKVPRSAIHLFIKVLDSLGKGMPISIIPVASEFTTQAAAEYLGCSRPHLVKLLEAGKIPFTKIGKHRRILFEDLRIYKQDLKSEQRNRLIEMMDLDEEAGMYDS